MPVALVFETLWASKRLYDAITLYGFFLFATRTPPLVGVAFRSQTIRTLHGFLLSCLSKA